MKRWLVLCIALAALLLLPKNTAGTDIGKLEPVGALRARSAGGMLALETDTGQRGVGRNLAEAAADMDETAAGKVFLETAANLLITPSAVKWLPELADYLRPNCRVCLDLSGEDLAVAAEYLAVHRPDMTLRLYRQGRGSLQVLHEREGRMYLGKP